MASPRVKALYFIAGSASNWHSIWSSMRWFEAEIAWKRWHSSASEGLVSDRWTRSSSSRTVSISSFALESTELLHALEPDEPAGAAAAHTRAKQSVSRPLTAPVWPQRHAAARRRHNDGVRANRNAASLDGHTGGLHLADVGLDGAGQGGQPRQKGHRDTRQIKVQRPAALFTFFFLFFGEERTRRRGSEGNLFRAGVIEGAGCGVRGEPSSFRFDIRQGCPPDLFECILTLTPFHASRLARTAAA